MKGRAELGEPVANATLTVLRNGNGSPVVKTSERGEFFVR